MDSRSKRSLRRQDTLQFPDEGTKVNSPILARSPVIMVYGLCVRCHYYFCVCVCVCTLLGHSMDLHKGRRCSLVQRTEFYALNKVECKSLMKTQDYIDSHATGSGVNLQSLCLYRLSKLSGKREQVSERCEDSYLSCTTAWLTLDATVRYLRDSCCPSVKWNNKVLSSTVGEE